MPSGVVDSSFPRASRGADYAAQAAQTPNVRQSQVRFAAPPCAACSLTGWITVCGNNSTRGREHPVGVDRKSLLSLRPDSETQQINALERSPCSATHMYLAHARLAC